MSRFHRELNRDLICECKRLEQEKRDLQRENDRLRALVEQSLDGVTDLEPEFKPRVIRGGAHLELVGED